MVDVPHIVARVALRLSVIVITYNIEFRESHFSNATESDNKNWFYPSL